MSSKPPIIIIGMHRSGTSLLTKFLAELGLFIGQKLDRNHEAIFFQQLNTWLLKLADSSWSHPASFQNMLQHKLLRKQSEATIHYWLSSRSSLDFLGLMNYLRYRTPHNLPFSWGWKDPRTTITLPIWLEIFPNAKVLHVVRNGVDVANSLLKRSQHALDESLHLPYGQTRDRIPSRKWYQGWLRRFPLPNIVDSARCLSFSSSFVLWEEYLEYANRNLTSLPEEQTLTIRYEDFLENAEHHLTNICRFIDLPANSNVITSLLRYIRPERAYAYSTDSQLEAIYLSVRKTAYMEKYGY